MASHPARPNVRFPLTCLPKVRRSTPLPFRLRMLLRGVRCEVRLSCTRFVRFFRSPFSLSTASLSATNRSPASLPSSFMNFRHHFIFRTQQTATQQFSHVTLEVSPKSSHISHIDPLTSNATQRQGSSLWRKGTQGSWKEI
jgi:hypothetical protein